MKVIVDAFGGDNAPIEILKGSRLAKDEYSVDIILVGNKAEIEKAAKENDIDISGMEIVESGSIITAYDSPTSVIKSKQDSSMAVGLSLLADGKGDAFVSAGSTGALVVGGTFIVKRIKGIKRAAIGTLMPSAENPFILLDAGANVECTSEFLNQFAIMGDIYMRRIMNVSNPRVALANIGEEETKGTKLYQDAYKLMKESNYNFIGNIEARDIPYGKADVIVADGFTGNIILKTYEGAAGALAGMIKAMFKKNVLTMLSALLVKSGIDEFKSKMDYKEFGGAPLMGICKPVIKAHGSSDARAFKNAIRQAKMFAENNVISEIENNLPKTNTNSNQE